MSTTVRQPKGRWGQPEGASAPVHGSGVVGEPRVVEEPRELLDPVTQLALLASSDPNPGAELDGLRDMPGLAARLASMAEELRLITRSYPTWCLPEVGVGDAVGQAQRVRDLAHNLTAVLAGEVTSRGLGMREGLSRNDWLAAQAPALDGAGAAELTAVGAVMSEPRWRELAGMVRSGATTVDRAAVIVRFHQDAVSFAERTHLDDVVDAMVQQAEVLGVRELRRLVRQARVSLRPPEQVDAEDARMRAGRSLSRVGRSAGLIEYRLRLDPEGAAVLDAAIDPLARPRPDLDWQDRPSPYRHPVCGHVIPEPVAGPDDPGAGRHAGEPAAARAYELAGEGSPAQGLIQGLVQGAGAALGLRGQTSPTSQTGQTGQASQTGQTGQTSQTVPMGQASQTSPIVPMGQGGRTPVGEHAPEDAGRRAAGTSDDRSMGPVCEVCAVPVADPRLPAARRADALLELVGRAVAAPMGVTRTPRAKVVLTMSYEALVGLVNGAGVAGNDEVLSAGTVRRLACEAGVVPMVLGGSSQVLDLAYTERYFTPAQRLALAVRDGGCSYPGCTVPAQWCDAHHVVHWADGGPTDLLNGALLCGRHHTRVHELGLTAHVTPEMVVWSRPPAPEHRTAQPPAGRTASSAGPAPP